jgi:hypothetical protein
MSALVREPCLAQSRCPFSRCMTFHVYDWHSSHQEQHCIPTVTQISNRTWLLLVPISHLTLQFHIEESLFLHEVLPTFTWKPLPLCFFFKKHISILFVQNRNKFPWLTPYSFLPVCVFNVFSLISKWLPSHTLPKLTHWPDLCRQHSSLPGGIGAVRPAALTPQEKRDRHTTTEGKLSDCNSHWMGKLW